MKPTHAKPSLYAFYYEICKEIGMKYGYNIVLHGSMNRDLDLIAIPWQEELKSKSDMLNEIAEMLGGFILEVDQESFEKRVKQLHGREQYVINLNRTIKSKYHGMVSEFIDNEDPQYYIDISITPTINF